MSIREQESRKANIQDQVVSFEREGLFLRRNAREIYHTDIQTDWVSAVNEIFGERFISQAEIALDKEIATYKWVRNDDSETTLTITRALDTVDRWFSLVLERTTGQGAKTVFGCPQISMILIEPFTRNVGFTEPSSPSAALRESNITVFSNGKASIDL